MHTPTCWWLALALLLGQSQEASKVTPVLDDYVKQRAEEFDQISGDRRQQLDKLSNYVRRRLDSKLPIRLTFICTHNSRRSHFAQIWAVTAATHYGVSGVEAYSGGTEATAFNTRAVGALRRAGFEISNASDGNNPHYLVRFHSEAAPLECFSKVYSHSPNPAMDFCAVMTCSQADRSCPNVAGATVRIAIPYDDPKAFDGTPQESAKYDERCRQIAREMLYVFSNVVR